MWCTRSAPGAWTKTLCCGQPQCAQTGCGLGEGRTAQVSFEHVAQVIPEPKLRWEDVDQRERTLCGQEPRAQGEQPL